MAELRIESGLLWIPGAASVFSPRRPSTVVSRIYHRRVGRVKSLAAPEERRPEYHGTSRNASERLNGAITNRIRNIRDSWLALVFYYPPFTAVSCI